jgi:hypothetical protein
MECAMDHRWGLRITIDAPVLLIYPAHATGTGRMTEVSMSGALVRTDFAPPDLAWIHIAGGIEETEAYAVRRGLHWIAVEWVEFSPLPIRALLAPLTATRIRLPDAREKSTHFFIRRSAHA